MEAEQKNEEKRRKEENHKEKKNKPAVLPEEDFAPETRIDVT